MEQESDIEGERVRACDYCICYAITLYLSPRPFDFQDFLCIWNTNFQTLQAGKELPGKVYGQVGLFIKHIPGGTIP